MALTKHSATARRLRLIALSTSLGLLATTAAAQGIGDAIRGGLDRQLQRDQRGTLDPAERGIGEAIQGVIRGDDVGQAVRRGVGEAARTAGETPRETMRRDRFESRQLNGRPLYDAQGRPLYDAQGRPLYDSRAPQFGSRAAEFDSRASGYDSLAPQYSDQGIAVQAQPRARLGISMQDVDRGIQVQQVMQGSAAAHAGLRSGDVILSVDGRQISDPNALSNLIRQRQPGDQVEMIIVRNGQQQRINATLTGFDNVDRQRVARPSLEAESNGDLRVQVQQLQDEVRQLRMELDRLNGRASADVDATLDADADADADAAPRQRDADLDVDADVDARARTDRPELEVPAAPAPTEGADAEADIDAEADLDAEADTEADASIGAEAEADLEAEVPAPRE